MGCCIFSTKVWFLWKIYNSSFCFYTKRDQQTSPCPTPRHPIIRQPLYANLRSDFGQFLKKEIVGGEVLQDQVAAAVFKFAQLVGVAPFIRLGDIPGIVEGVFQRVAVYKGKGAARGEAALQAFEQGVKVLQQDMAPDKTAKQSLISAVGRQLVHILKRKAHMGVQRSLPGNFQDLFIDIRRRYGRRCLGNALGPVPAATGDFQHGLAGKQHLKNSAGLL